MRDYSILSDCTQEFSWPIKIWRSHGELENDDVVNAPIDEESESSLSEDMIDGRLCKTINLQSESFVKRDLDCSNVPIAADHSKWSSLIVDFLGDFVIFQTSTLHAMFMKGQDTILQAHYEKRRNPSGYVRLSIRHLPKERTSQSKWSSDKVRRLVRVLPWELTTLMLSRREDRSCSAMFIERELFAYCRDKSAPYQHLFHVESRTRHWPVETLNRSDRMTDECWPSTARLRQNSDKIGNPLSFEDETRTTSLDRSSQIVRHFTYHRGNSPFSPFQNWPKRTCKHSPTFYWTENDRRKIRRREKMRSRYLLLTPTQTMAYWFSGEKIISKIEGSAGIEMGTVFKCMNFLNGS